MAVVNVKFVNTDLAVASLETLKHWSHYGVNLIDFTP